MDALEDIEGMGEEIGLVGVAPKLEDASRDVKEDGVYDDHGETSAEDSVAMYDEVKSGPEDEGLTCHHAHPGDEFHGDGKFVCIDVVDDEKVPQTKGDNAEGSDEQAPEVAPAIALEGRKAEDDQLDGIIPGYADEASQNGVLSEPIDRPFGEAEAAARDLDSGHEGIFFAASEDRKWSCEGFYEATMEKAAMEARVVWKKVE